MMTPRKVAIGLLGAALALAGCSSSDDATSEPRDNDNGDADVESTVDADTGPATVAPVSDMSCDGEEPTGDPIVVGGSLSLTGNFAATAAIHDAVSEITVDWVNECGGIDGRPLEWSVLDDASTPGTAASNYENLLNQGVDLVMGPYGTANILAAAGPVSRAGYAYPTHSFGTPTDLVSEGHFPTWQFGGGAGTTEDEDFFAPASDALWEALEGTGEPPATAFYAIAKFPSTISVAGVAQATLEDNGVETLERVEFDLGTTDFSSLALRIQQADPDFIYWGSLGADVVNLYDAFATIGYVPKQLFAMLAAPAALESLGSEADGVYTLSIYEENSTLQEDPQAELFVEKFHARAAEDGLFPVVETQAAASFAAWQVLLTAVANVGVDNADVIDFLHEAEVETIAGPMSFGGFNGYGVDVNRITQIQDGERYLVAPSDLALVDPAPAR